MSSHMAGRLPLSSPPIADPTAHHPFLDSTGSSGSLASLYIAVLAGVHLGAWICLNESQRILLWLWAFKPKGWPHKTVGIWEEMERMSLLVPATWAFWLPKLQMRLTATAASRFESFKWKFIAALGYIVSRCRTWCIHQATAASSKKQHSGYYCTSKDLGRHLRVSQNEYIHMPQGIAAKLKNCMYYLIIVEWSCSAVWHWNVWRSKKEGFVWDLQLTVLLWHTIFLSFVKILL
jgi:hypothetical protein